MLKFGLEMAGYGVDVADDSDAGLMLADTRAPAVAIIDIDVRPVNGWALAKTRREVFGPHIRLVAVTSRDDPEDVDRSRAACFDVHLLKPVSPNFVRQTVRKMLAS